MKKGVQVSTLCPGPTKTNFFAQEGTKTPREAMTSEEVARYTYKQLMKNKEIIIPGFINKIKIKFPEKLKIMAIAKMKK
jgi:short-subunit dehydrogenase